MYRRVLTCLLSTAALLGGEIASAAPVVIMANQAAGPPRTNPGAGLCLNSIHLITPGGPYFPLSSAGITQAVGLLDAARDGMKPTPIDLVAQKQSYSNINFRNIAPGANGDFNIGTGNPPIYFPFGQMGTPQLATANGGDLNVAERVRGYLNVTTAGFYTFAARANSYARLTIAGTVVTDAAEGTLPGNMTGVITRQTQFLKEGLYPFEVVHFQNGTISDVELAWAPGQLTETTAIALTPPPPASPYKLLGSNPTELYSAAAGTGTCQECANSGQCQPADNYCQDGLCQPCIVTAHCGPQCVPCTGATPICDVPNPNGADPAATAKCVQCVTNVDCMPGGTCDLMGNCHYPCTPGSCKAGFVCDVDLGTCEPEPPQCTATHACEMGTCNLDLGMCVSQCQQDTDCPMAGQFCQNGICNSCPAGMTAAPRTPSQIAAGVPPQCGKPGYRGGCSATGTGGGNGAAGTTGLALLALGLLALLRRRRSITAALRASRSILMMRTAAAGAAAFFLLGASPTHAQSTPQSTTASINAQTFQPAFGPNNILTVDGSRTPGQTTFLFNALLEYAHNPLRYVVTLSDGTLHTVDQTVADMAVLHLQAGLGIGRFFQAGAELPVLYQNLGKPTPEINTGNISNWGLGDLRLMAKARILNNEWDGFGLALAGQLTIPLPVSGDFNTVGQNLHSAGQIGIEPRLVLDYHWHWGMQIALNAGFLAYAGGAQQQIPNVVTISHQVRYGLGAFVPVSKSVGFWGEVFGSASVSSLVNGREYAPLEGMLGLRIMSAGGFVMNLGVGSGFLGDVGSPQVRALLSLGYLPSYVDPDIDHDGVLNEVDRCPTVPGPVENQGCPDEDWDKDGIVNRLDKCPYEPGPKENQGCPDKDTDGDGTVDRLDKCPTVPGPKENHGCPWPDTDGDGVIDPEDKCPTVPGPKENHGCPWPDTDGDGIIDPEDKCPLEPGPRENQGCPDKDTDGDGIVDRLDQCPLVPGVPPTGCPEKKYIVVTAEKIELKQKIFFATNKSKVLPPSFDLLNEVVSVLKERPTMRLRIEGHTDSRGTLQWNMELSRSRADSVRQYLIDGGIDGGRLTSEGYGPTRPIGDNKTDEGREKNRRTEFFIEQQ